MWYKATGLPSTHADELLACSKRYKSLHKVWLEYIPESGCSCLHSRSYTFMLLKVRGSSQVAQEELLHIQTVSDFPRQ